MTRPPAQFETNAAGRKVPREINGTLHKLYAGLGRTSAEGKKWAPPVRNVSQYPLDGDKRLPSLEAALAAAGLRDGMTMSTHHHLRDGDRVSIAALTAAARLGVKGLRWFPSAAFPCHAPAIELMRAGVIDSIEGSLNGVLGEYCSHGKMRSTGILRSHGGRWQAIQDGEVHIDVAVIAAPCADAFGNANGLSGPSACGPLGFALADSIYADYVIVVTDHLVPFPCVPWHIQGNNVDAVVEVHSIGDPGRIVSGSTNVASSGVHLKIAQLAADFIKKSGILREGFSFQAGAGGIPLATASYLDKAMRTQNVRARFVRGGSTKLLVDMLQDGYADYLLDGQAFDLNAVKSMMINPRHVPTNPFTSYNFHGKGNFASLVDVAVLGATEVDIEFNANVVSHSDGRLLHGIGGWQDCLFSKCSILVLPAVRQESVSIRQRVTTLTGPAELIDVIVTEFGIAINPLRKDLMELTREAELPVVDLAEMKEIAERACGRQIPFEPEDEAVAVIKWVDGTVLDCVWRLHDGS